MVNFIVVMWLFALNSCPGPSPNYLPSWEQIASFPVCFNRNPPDSSSCFLTLSSSPSSTTLLCALVPRLTAVPILFTDSFHARQNKPSWWVCGRRSGRHLSWKGQHCFLAPSKPNLVLVFWSMSCVFQLIGRLCLSCYATRWIIWSSSLSISESLPSVDVYAINCD